MRSVYVLSIFILYCYFDIVEGQTPDRFTFLLSRNRVSSLRPATGQSVLGIAAAGSVTISDPLTPCHPRPTCPGNVIYYRPDGTCNNLHDSTRGAVDRPLKRLLPPDYADGIGQPRRRKNGQALPSAREISTKMQGSFNRKSPRLTQMVPFFGQYIVHDISSAPTTRRTSPPAIDCSCGSLDPACFNIPIATNDIQFTQEGRTCLPLVRSQPVRDANKCTSNVRQQHNSVTSYIDASTVYGSSQDHFAQLFEPSSTIGKLKRDKLSPHGLMSKADHPILPVGSQVTSSFADFMACPAEVHKPASVPCFVAGDERANENSVLASMHTMFLRFHNLVVEGLHDLNPHWKRQRLILTARSIVASVHQLITYKEFLPVLLGGKNMRKFGLKVLQNGYSFDYHAFYDATVSNAFSAAAFRFGHTLIPETIKRYRKNWSPVGPNIRLKDSFFNANPLLFTTHGGTNSMIRGITKDPALKFDPTFADDMRNFLFAPAGQLGSDLLAINIQRGRDHGIPSYNAYRVLAGLKKATKWNHFKEIPAQRRSKLRMLYGDVDEVDLYIGAISETPVKKGVVGPTFAYIIGRQFRDLKRGDRFWHENGGINKVFTRAQLKAIRKMSLASLICATSDTATIQQNPFLKATFNGRNKRKLCKFYPSLKLKSWKKY